MPEIARVRLAAEVGFEELRGSDALDVPQVEILVTAQSEEAAVVLAKLGLADTRQIAARTDQRRRIAMPPAAVAAGDDIARQSVVSGKGVSVSVDVVGHRFIKKKTKHLCSQQVI